MTNGQRDLNKITDSLLDRRACICAEGDGRLETPRSPGKALRREIERGYERAQEKQLESILI